jgi:hypothetical protein
MPMPTPRPTAFALALTLAALAGCATTHGNLTSSADRLERNSSEFARDARDESQARDARDLADQTHDFRRTVEDNRADKRDVDAAFEHLSRTYHGLRDEVERSDSSVARDDLKPVTDAYLDVEREMGGYPDGHRYAHEHDYSRDRY